MSNKQILHRVAFQRLLLVTFSVVFSLTTAALFEQQSAFGQGAAASGAVFTMTNAAAGNEVLVYPRAAGGALSPATSFSTGGLGSGGALGNQGGLLLSDNNRWLFVVNAGSNEISVFDVERNGLSLIDTAPSGGLRPISLTLHGRLLYVLNAGGLASGQDNITGFIVGRRGNLTHLPGSTRPLSANMTDPAQIAFSPDGGVLIVTEKATNKITTYLVSSAGTPGPPIVQSSIGMTPFGFAFGKRGHLVVSEAFGGAANASATSSYDLSAEGLISVISPSVPTTQTAACWVLISKDGDFGFVTNTGSSSISSYGISREASLTLLAAMATTTGAGPIDMALSNNGRFLYVLNSGSGSIGGYEVDQEGSLSPLPSGASGLPASANGLAAR